MSLQIRPCDLPIVRNEAIKLLEAHGASMYQSSVAKREQHFAPNGLEPAAAGQLMAKHELGRLKLAELFFVSSDMVRLAKAAERSLPAYSLMPEDLPTESGFIFFERSISTMEYEQNTSPIRAASWGPMWEDRPRSWVHGGVWITWYADLSQVIASGMERGTIDRHLEEAARLKMAALGRLSVDNESPIPFSPDPLDVCDPVTGKETPYSERGEDTLFPLIGILKTVWLLMGQTLTTVSDARYDRASRRRLLRQQEDLTRVRVVALRKMVGDGSAAASDREYQHQWIVRGHWRQQWYPGRSVHRPMWIAPHIKGPDGAPLLGGEKVYALKR
jgi:hypothetical protein